MNHFINASNLSAETLGVVMSIRRKRQPPPLDLFPFPHPQVLSAATFAHLVINTYQPTPVLFLR